MSLVKLFNNKHVINLGIKLCQLIPPRLAYAIIGFVAWIISRFQRSDLIQAIQANQQMVSGSPTIVESDLKQKARAVIRHAMICYYDFFHYLNSIERMATRFPAADDLLADLAALTADTGAMIITPHLSNFNLVFHVITSKGFTTKLLTLTNIYSGYDLINELRESVGAEIIPADEGDHFAELKAHLEAGGTVSTGVDRPIAGRKSTNRLNFFGKPSDLPAGYISLALAADVPVIILSIHMREDGIYAYELIGPIQMENYASRIETITKNAERILEHIAFFIRQAPEQWLMYYPVWPEQTGGAE